MNRRAFLAAITSGTIGIAGCSSIGFSNGNSPTRNSTPVELESPTQTDSPTPTESTTPTSKADSTPPAWASVLEAEDFPRTSIIDLETIPRTYALVPTTYHTDDGAKIRMTFSETGTTDHPPRLVASLKNRNPFENTFGLDWTPPFGRLGSDHPRPPDERYSTRDVTYRDTLAFVPTQRHQLVDDPPGVTLAEDGTWRFHGGGTAGWLPERIRLEPEETIYGEYFVAGHPEGAGNGRPTGIYEFSRGQRGDIQIGVWNTDHPGPDETSRFAGISVPHTPHAESLAWYHEADSTTPSYVKPSVEQTDFPAAIDFTFINHSKDDTGCGHWNLYKLHEDQWFHLGPFIHTADCRMLSPGGSKQWTLHAFHGEGLEAREAAVFGYLGGGMYTAVAGYGHATSSSAALVELTGPSVTISPTDDLTVERSNGTVTVTSPLWEDDEHPPSATLTATRTKTVDRILLAEQVMTTGSTFGRHTRFRGLRNTIPFFEESVNEVILRTDEHVAESATGHDSGVLKFRVGTQTQAYRVEIDQHPDTNQ